MNLLLSLVEERSRPNESSEVKTNFRFTLPNFITVTCLKIHDFKVFQANYTIDGIINDMLVIVSGTVIVLYNLLKNPTL